MTKIILVAIFMILNIHPVSHLHVNAVETHYKFYEQVNEKIIHKTYSQCMS